MADLAAFQAQAQKIRLSDGTITIVDAEDLGKLSQYKWKPSAGYAARSVWDKVRKTSYTVGMHRLITDCPRGYEVDHINGDRLDNRKSNLRVCLPSENSRNKKHYGIKSRFKGVLVDTSRLKRVGQGHSSKVKYRAQIVVNGKLKHLGYFDNDEVAANAYNNAAIEHYGRFAKLNEVSHG